jgi:HAD superfamily hydrolase (TIGR01509 family)
VLIADRLTVPDGTGALLWDMDGVLLDTLTMDYELVNCLLAAHAAAVEVPRKAVQAYFPYDIPDFWRLLLDELGLELPRETFDELVLEHEKARESSEFAVHDGIVEILADARSRGLLTAVVSNNPEADVNRMLVTAGLRDYFSIIVGNDDPGIAKKPAPDSYLEAVRRLAIVTPYVALEDSLLGAQAAKAAGCWTVGVATGASDFDSLSSSPYVDRCYVGFAPCRVALGREDTAEKSLVTPNEFVSQMIRHIAWRLGCSIDVSWTNDDWLQLGRELGHRIAGLHLVQDSSSALGTFDDDSCELALRLDGIGSVRLRAAAPVDLDWLLPFRCRPLPDGQPLVSLLQGLGAGCGVSFDILVASAEDPHYAWEWIFQGIGVGLNELTSARESAKLAVAEQGWVVTRSWATGVKLRKETAESAIEVELALVPGVKAALA